MVQVPSLYRKLKACACGTTACREFRKLHNFGDAVVKVTASSNWPVDRQERHLRAIGLNQLDVKATMEKIKEGKDVRIAIWHYYSEDRQQVGGKWTISALTKNPRQLVVGRRRELNTPLPNRSLGSNADGDGGADSPNFRHNPEWRPLEQTAGPSVASTAAAAVSDRTARRQARASVATSVATAQPPQLVPRCSWCRGAVVVQAPQRPSAPP